MIKISGVVILFYPNEQTIFNISTYVNQLDRLFVIDNSEKVNEKIKSNLIENSKIIYLDDGKNNGIAERLNQAVQLAKDINSEWLLTMDQDSFFENNTLLNYINYVDNFSLKANVAMFGLSFNNQILKEDNSYEKAVHLITSASILNIRLFDAIGPFDENLFIDEVDSEYCYRAILKGFLIIKFTNLSFKHSLGEIKRGLSLKTFTYTPRTLHSPIRLYYMVRNYFYLLKKHPSLDESQKIIMKNGLLLRIKNNLLYNNKRFSVVKLIFKAYLDFKKGRMGKFSKTNLK